MWRYFSGLCVVLFISPSASGQSEWSFNDKLDLQVRSDARSDRDHRTQYRIRYYPQLAMGESWSLNSFIVTGSDFSSSHNTLFDGSSQQFHVRRFYVRHTSSGGKTEIGIIPTYKGRVSSTGLSKDGWIEGIRHVVNLNSHHAVELVAGQLDNQDPSDALQLPAKLDYAELEYSGRFSDKAGFEISLERMTGGNFVRSEYRYAWHPQHEVFIEWIQRLDQSRNKAIIGVAGEGAIKNYPLSYFVYASRVDEGLGFRAELTEDFLGYGHGFSGEIGGSALFAGDAEWFIRLDVVDNVERVLTGLKMKL